MSILSQTVQYEIGNKVRIKYLDTNYYGKIVKIENNVLTIIIESHNNILTTLSWINDKFVLPGNTIPQELIFDEIEFDDLDVYVKMCILVQADHETFVQLSKTNKILHAISSNKLPKEIIASHGNMANFLYPNRIDTWFRSDIKKFKETNMNWKEFYKRILLFYRFKNEHGIPALIRREVTNGHIMECRILWSWYRDRIIFNEVAILTYHTVYEWFEFMDTRQINTCSETLKNSLNILEWLSKTPRNITTYKNREFFSSSLYNLNLVKWLLNKNICTVGELYELAVKARHKRTITYLQTLM